MVFSRQEYWSGLPSPPPVHLPNPAIEPVSPASQVHSLLLSHQGSPSTGSRSLNLMKNTQLILFTAWLCQLFWRRTLFIFLAVLVERKWVTQLCPTLCNPHWLYSPWNSPGQDTGVVSCCLLQGIFLTRNHTRVSCIAGGFFTSWATREAQAKFTSLHLYLPLSSSPLLHSHPFPRSSWSCSTSQCKPAASVLGIFFLLLESPACTPFLCKPHFLPPSPCHKHIF